ncbi:bifunctional riboflavin kinase/FAD synthetase [Bacillus sonorensis]|uniref:bifunctional riboflavin kinase/FAD synthetase n=1 Tax=Bacillus sonorensis TaxID=119858 RepID=UPI00049591D4|nr:bifunctional riboflavin kinase/FAD synthetase [Bacillus sonorensis]MCF7618823.1 bifunctional riboflavin kinase/FAD synthetase [Bacillus sonorensis]MCY8032057.1 bifunctional riboflavin kinase/FAD synthetase [Bacillus sonorensis]MCY8086743.1 bifunctional riboflavin kinase/FAD synthetase [Bacillus sonorensis]MCY8405829.1 bifunctional riboflavin kinase/FAD synthetase [Bacillus sonorensis]MCY8565019.1 bifunctional riboflavin kinase/FAD synthetase [Bacillus sonorensis]
MKTIHISHPHELKREDFPTSVMALGYFDGVHLGHQQVILAAKNTADREGVKTSVMTFHPHPSAVLKKGCEPKDLITPLREKIKIIEGLGADFLYIVEFSPEFASLSPETFIEQYIIGFNVCHVVAGFDFTFGKFGKGTMENFHEYAKGRVKSTAVAKYSNQDQKVSSTRIRSVIGAGDVEYAAELLGRPYYVKGIVIHGDKRGRTIGFPTANIGLSDTYIVPPTGVYAVKAEIDGASFNGVCNVGYKPTFYEKRPGQPSIEVNLFDFNREIYGSDIKIEWYKRLRSEKKFGSVGELVAQITKDKEEATRYFKEGKLTEI